MHPFELCFSKEGMDDTVQNRPASDLDGLVRVWPNTSLQKQVRVLERNRPAAIFSLPDSVPFFYRCPG